jgi:hypothetical protein
VFKMADVCRENVPSFTVSSSHTVQHNITVMCMYVCTRSRFCVCTALTTESLCSKVTYETITTVQLTMYYVLWSRVRAADGAGRHSERQARDESDAWTQTRPVPRVTTQR